MITLQFTWLQLDIVHVLNLVIVLHDSTLLGSVLFTAAQAVFAWHIITGFFSSISKLSSSKSLHGKCKTQIFCSHTVVLHIFCKALCFRNIICSSWSIVQHYTHYNTTIQLINPHLSSYATVATD